MALLLEAGEIFKTISSSGLNLDPHQPRLLELSSLRPAVSSPIPVPASNATVDFIPYPLTRTCNDTSQPALPDDDDLPRHLNAFVPPCQPDGKLFLMAGFQCALLPTVDDDSPFCCQETVKRHHAPPG